MQRSGALHPQREAAGLVEPDEAVEDLLDPGLVRDLDEERRGDLPRPGSSALYVSISCSTFSGWTIRSTRSISWI